MNSIIEQEIHKPDEQYPKMWRHRLYSKKRIILERENIFIVWCDADSSLIGTTVNCFEKKNILN